MHQPPGADWCAGIFTAPGGPLPCLTSGVEHLGEGLRDAGQAQGVCSRGAGSRWSDMCLLARSVQQARGCGAPSGGSGGGGRGAALAMARLLRSARRGQRLNWLVQASSPATVLLEAACMLQHHFVPHSQRISTTTTCHHQKHVPPVGTRFQATRNSHCWPGVRSDAADLPVRAATATLLRAARGVAVPQTGRPVAILEDSAAAILWWQKGACKWGGLGSARQPVLGGLERW